ncbi:hypothetical protein F4782DRAFT_516691 [Xylaria castorea]|nr:hypothetical protein F4782DRAFT_516691 [Xylaria castorea]
MEDSGGIAPFIIYLSDSEEEDVYCLSPTETTFTNRHTPLPVHGDSVENKIKDNFELSPPLPRHSDVERLVELLDLGDCAMAGNGDVPPGSIDIAESEDVYSPSAQTTFASKNTPIPIHGGVIEDSIEVSCDFNAPFPSYPRVEHVASLLNLARVGNDGIPPVRIDVAGFENDISYTEPAKTIFTSRDIPLAKQVKFDQVTVPMTDDDVVMTDATKQVPVLLDGSRDVPLPSWMAGFFQPSFLHKLAVCNLKEITLESDKIHFSFA